MHLHVDGTELLLDDPGRFHLLGVGPGVLWRRTPAAARAELPGFLPRWGPGPATARLVTMSLEPTKVEASGRRRTVVTTVVVVAVAAYSYVAAGTTPFTAGADAMTALSFAAVAVVMVSSLVRRRRQGQTRLSTDVAAGGSVVPWTVVLSVFVVWEVVTYAAGFAGGRHAFPTVSSLTDQAFRWRGAKAALFAAWLALGWGLVRR